MKTIEMMITIKLTRNLYQAFTNLEFATEEVNALSSLLKFSKIMNY